MRPTLHRMLLTLSLAAAAGMSAFSSQTLAADWPQRPVHIIVPYPAGGSTDLVSRLVAQRLSQSLGQQVLVENRSGGATMIGTGAAARAAPDGYTLLATANVFAVNVLLSKSPSYQVSDFTPIAAMAGYSYVLVVNPSLPVRSVAELTTFARQQPGKLNAASLGAGGVTHLLTARFEALAGVSITTIDYKGSAPAMTDLLGGQIQMYFDTLITSMPNLRADRLRALAVSTPERSDLLPAVPSFRELGLPGMTQRGWLGLFGPAGTPTAIIDRINRDVRAAVQTEELRARYLADGMFELPFTPQEFASFIKDDLKPWASTLRELNLQLD